MPRLFVGKLVLDDIAVWHDLVSEGVLLPPRFIPPHFADNQGLVSWFSFSRFIGGLNFQQLEADYAQLL